MAHFARLQNNMVSEVIVVNNDILLDENGQEQESLGIDFCKSLFGENTQWIQTSYTGKIRGKYAGLGDIYDSTTDEFVSLQNNL